MELSMTEKYALLLLNAIGKHTDYMACQYSAGIVLGGLLELSQNGFISIGRNGKLAVSQKLTEEYGYLWTLYSNIKSGSPKSFNKWLEFYCFSPTYKNLRPIINDIFNALSDSGYIFIQRTKGIFRVKTSVTVNASSTMPVIRGYKENVLNNSEDEDVIFCTQMLLLADVFKMYFPMGQRAAIKQTLTIYKHTGLWKTLEPYTNSVRNFNYQNTVYTGASQ